MKNYLDLGNWNALCDSCGRKFKASQLKRRWDGLMVCEEDYELRHPSDFLRVQRERISVPWARPYPAEDTYINVPYLCTPQGTSGITNLAVAGCSLCASPIGPWWIERTAISGVAIATLAIAGET